MRSRGSQLLWTHPVQIRRAASGGAGSRAACRVNDHRKIVTVVKVLCSRPQLRCIPTDRNRSLRRRRSRNLGPQKRPDQPGGAGREREWPLGSSKQVLTRLELSELEGIPGQTVKSHLLTNVNVAPLTPVGHINHKIDDVKYLWVLFKRIKLLLTSAEKHGNAFHLEREESHQIYTERTDKREL